MTLPILRVKYNLVKIWLHDMFGRLLGISNVYRMALKDAALEIASLRSTIQRLDRKASLDVRGQMELLDFDKLGDIIWIKVSDDRMLRYDVFNQVRDYLRGHGKDRAILLLTGTNVQIESLTDADLTSMHLRRMTKEEETAEWGSISTNNEQP